jgi:hypothetical protein
MGYARDSRIFLMKNSRKFLGSVWRSVTTGTIKEGYSNPGSGRNSIHDYRIHLITVRHTTSKGEAA